MPFGNCGDVEAGSSRASPELQRHRAALRHPPIDSPHGDSEVLRYLALRKQRFGIALKPPLAAFACRSEVPKLAHRCGYPLSEPWGTQSPISRIPEPVQTLTRSLVVFVAIRRVAVIWAVALVASGFVVGSSGFEVTAQLLVLLGLLLGVVGGGYGRT